MLNILINSYTCCPGMGSEPGMGWNWIVSIAKTCEVFVITEGEFKQQIETWLNDTANMSLATHLHFYWNPVPQSTRDKCWNQGNWSFYPLYKKWQRKTANIARDICKTEEIDILHQLNMIGFREPGYLHEVSKETGIPLIWGPIGGLKMFPMAYVQNIKKTIFYWMKNEITKWQIAYDSRIKATLMQSSVLISAIPDSYNAIKKYHGFESIIIPETGCIISKTGQQNSNRFNNETLNVIWVGKFDFRKRLDIALKAISRTKNKKIHLKVFGTGNKQQVEEAKYFTEELGIGPQIEFKGGKSNNEVKIEMKSSDVFLFTSVSEDTSTVVLEAISNNLPVVCFDCCGMAAVIDDKVGIKIPLTNPKQSIKDFADVLNDLYNHREKLVEMSKSCRQRAEELSWTKKAKQMIALYEKAIDSTKR